MNTHSFSPLKKVLFSCMIIGIFLFIMLITENLQAFSSNRYQIRIAASLFALAYFYPFLVIPLGIADSLANVFFSESGYYGIIGGFFIGVITSYLITLIKKKDLNYLLVALPIVFVAGIGAPIWLAPMYRIPYLPYVRLICIVQAAPATLGMLLVSFIKRFDNK